jgi:hypothetical protein
MARTTRADLDQLADIINHALLCEPGTPCAKLDPARAFTVEWAYGRPRLFRARGSVEVSPRLTAGELAQWMRAFIDGINAAQWLPKLQEQS